MTCSIDSCDEPISCRGWCVSHYSRWYRHGDPEKQLRILRLGNGFDYTDSQFVDTSGDCWLWTGYTSSRGYPVLGGLKESNEYTHVHRYVLEQKISRELEEGEYSLHHCDTPACVKPSHLWAGSHEDNMRDMDEKGRRYISRGEEHGRTSLTAEQVVEMRKRYRDEDDVSYNTLVDEYGVSKSTVARIIKRVVWTHVGPEEGAAA